MGLGKVAPPPHRPAALRPQTSYCSAFVAEEWEWDALISEALERRHSWLKAPSWQCHRSAQPGLLVASY